MQFQYNIITFNPFQSFEGHGSAGEGGLPLIVTGDFKVNFNHADSLPLLNFFQVHLNLTMNNNRELPTTRGGTTIDAVFSRY